MTYSEAIQFLYQLRWFGAKFGLDNTFKLAALAGNPQAQLRFIHVAGTNGKGSTCAMLESIYRTAGLRVGLFTSPHLVSFRERIQVNRHLIPEADVVRLVTRLRDWLKGFPADHQPTFFEAVTVMALKFFAEQQCELVIWETGLGGRLDATNIVMPLASVITNIALDHQPWLGNTLGEIAAEKAGIIKPGLPILTAADEPEALAVIEQIARKKKAPLEVVRAGGQPLPGGRGAGFQDTFAVSLAGEHQRVNAALALATVQVLQPHLPVTEPARRAGLETIHWPGRLQQIIRPDGRRFLLDGAHNVAGAKALATALEKDFPAPQRTLVLGVLQDKDWVPVCRTLAPLAGRIFTVPIASERTADPNDLAAACRAVLPAGEITPCHSLAEAFDRAAGDEFIVVAGSLYLVGEALERLGLFPAAAERGLNEWRAEPLALSANELS